MLGLSPRGPLALIGDENASLRSRPLEQRRSAMQRSQSKQTEPLQDRIASFIREIREKASRLPPGKEKDDLLRRVRLADAASHVSDWVNSPSLQPRK
jgi:hypothetical protein